MNQRLVGDTRQVDSPASGFLGIRVRRLRFWPFLFWPRVVGIGAFLKHAINFVKKDEDYSLSIQDDDMILVTELNADNTNMHHGSCKKRNLVHGNQRVSAHNSTTTKKKSWKSKRILIQHGWMPMDGG